MKSMCVSPQYFLLREIPIMWMATHEFPLPLQPPGRRVYLPACTGCVSPLWATWTGEHNLNTSRMTMSMYLHAATLRTSLVVLADDSDAPRGRIGDGHSTSIAATSVPQLLKFVCCRGSFVVFEDRSELVDHLLFHFGVARDAVQGPGEEEGRGLVAGDQERQ
mmetsp:Transcript_44599/g.95837  ORF Transcript_44599/g.95837 Transcript_44599/m.95837 type:complete len:163 (-) Transcript_44599:163-651(-)